MMLFAVFSHQKQAKDRNPHVFFFKNSDNLLIIALYIRSQQRYPSYPYIHMTINYPHVQSSLFSFLLSYHSALSLVLLLLELPFCAKVKK